MILFICKGMSSDGSLPTLRYPATSQSGGLEFVGVM